MALVLNDRVKETTTSTGTGTVNLAGAETGFETFVAGVGNTNTTYYAIVHQSADEFEVGLGTVSDSSPDTLSRTTIISSSNSDSAVNFSAGTKDVFCTLPASKVVFEDASNNVEISSGDVAIGSRGTNPMGLGITGTVLAVSEASNVASVQIDGKTGTRIDMGTNSSRNAVFYTDANQLEISRTTNHPIKFVVNSSEIARFVSTELKLASGKKLVGGASGVDLTIQSENRTQIQGASKGTLLLNDSGTVYGLFERPTSTNDFDIQNPISDGDITFVGNDGGSSITALTLDMSDAGSAYFNDKVGISNTSPRGALEVGSGTGSTGVQSYFSVSAGYTDPAAANVAHPGGAKIILWDDSTTPQKASIGMDSNADIWFNNAGAQTGGFTFYTANGGSATPAARLTITKAGNVGIGTSSPSVALGVTGEIIASDNITAYGTPSDIRLKENIEVIDNALDKVKKLKGITYDLKSDGNRLTGLIAQDLQKVLPEAVYETSAVDDADDKHLAIRYGNTVGLLVEAIKEQQQIIEDLKLKIEVNKK